MARHDQPTAGARIAQSRSNATETGRINQKLRTRQALVDAARDLVAPGASPTLAEVADHALTSKTTAYRYFASAEALPEEVFFNQDFPTVDEALGRAGNDPTSRVLAVEEAVNNTLLTHERAMRVIVRNTLDTTLSSDDDGPPVSAVANTSSQPPWSRSKEHSNRKRSPACAMHSRWQSDLRQSSPPATSAD